MFTGAAGGIDDDGFSTADMQAVMKISSESFAKLMKHMGYVPVSSIAASSSSSSCSAGDASKIGAPAAEPVRVTPMTMDERDLIRRQIVDIFDALIPVTLSHDDEHREFVGA